MVSGRPANRQGDLRTTASLAAHRARSDFHRLHHNVTLSANIPDAGFLHSLCIFTARHILHNAHHSPDHKHAVAPRSLQTSTDALRRRNKAHNEAGTPAAYGLRSTGARWLSPWRRWERERRRRRRSDYDAEPALVPDLCANASTSSTMYSLLGCPSKGSTANSFPPTPQPPSLPSPLQPFPSIHSLTTPHTPPLHIHMCFTSKIYIPITSNSSNSFNSSQFTNRHSIESSTHFPPYPMIFPCPTAQFIAYRIAHSPIYIFDFDHKVNSFVQKKVSPI